MMDVLQPQKNRKRLTRTMDALSRKDAAFTSPAQDLMKRDHQSALKLSFIVDPERVVRKH